jgi:phage shock protein C
MSGYPDPTSKPNAMPPRPEPGASAPGGGPEPDAAPGRRQTGAGQSYDGPAFGPRRLDRSVTNRVWAGVCGGLAEHFGWDPTATRLGYAILTIFTGIFPMLMLYIVMAIVVPNGSTTANSTAGSSAYSAARSSASGAGAIVIGGLLILAGMGALLNHYFIIDWSWLGPTFVVGLGVLVILVSLPRRSTTSQ